MARQLKPYIDRIRNELVKHDLYHERNEMLITAVAEAMREREQLRDDRGPCSTVLSQIGSQGQTKIGIHPTVEPIARQDNIIIRGLAFLGLGNNLKVQPIEPNELEEFLNEITND